MTTKKKNKGLISLAFGLTVGVAGALAAVFFGKKENRDKTSKTYKKLKNSGKKFLKK